MTTESQRNVSLATDNHLRLAGWTVFHLNGDCTAMLGSAQLRNRRSATRVRNAPAVALHVLECYSKLTQTCLF